MNRLPNSLRRRRDEAYARLVDVEAPERSLERLVADEALPAEHAATLRSKLPSQLERIVPNREQRAEDHVPFGPIYL